MRAKSVFENIEFRRGQDPKRSMEIGAEAILIRDLEKWMEDFCFDTVTWAKATQELNDLHHNLAEFYRTKYKIEYSRNYWVNIPNSPGERNEYHKKWIWYLLDNMNFSEWSNIVKQMIYDEDEIDESMDFKRGGDPKKTMEIGLNKKLMGTKSWKVLEFIDGKGDEGTTLTEIQEYIYFVLNGAPLGKDWFWEKDWSGSRQSRGYANSMLYGRTTGGRNPYGGDIGGILKDFCYKKNGKWFVKRWPKEGEIIHYGRS